MWSVEVARELPGKMVLIGITYLRPDRSVLEQIQMFGRIEVADSVVGIVVALEGKRGGTKYTLPPDTRGIREAAPGEYALRSTGEVVVDPDYVVTYTGSKPAGS